MDSVLNVRCASRLSNKKRRGPRRIRRSLPQSTSSREGRARRCPTLPPESSPAPHAVDARKHHGAAPRPADDDGRI